MWSSGHGWEQIKVRVSTERDPKTQKLTQRKVEVSWGISPEEETRTMAKMDHTEEQIVAVLRQVEAGAYGKGRFAMQNSSS